MLKFIVWRIVQLPMILAIIYLITFLLVWVVPGSPFTPGSGRNLDPWVEHALRERFHAESAAAFLRFYPQRVLHGDLGPSLFYDGWSVNDVLRYSLPVSVALGLFAMVIATAGGCAVGVTAALHRDRVWDYAGLALALIGISLPGFVVAGGLLMTFSDHLHWFPSGGWGSFRQMVLPGIALALMPMAYIARLMRASMLDALGNDYIRTARAKGLNRSVVVWKHAMRNAFLPVFTYLAPAAAYAMTGSFVIETVFNIPGLGLHFVNGVKNRDQTLILGIVLVYATVLLMLNLLVDIGYALIDPRIDITESEGR